MKKEKECKYMNEYTGVLYFSLFHAVRSIISDMIHFPKCRTLKMWRISKVKIGGITEV